MEMMAPETSAIIAPRLADLRLGLSVGLLAVLLSACGEQDKGTGPVRVFVSNEANDRIDVFDGRSGALEGLLKTGERPRGMALSPDSRTLYVAASDANRIEAWDLRSLSRQRSYEHVSDPERFVLAPDGRSLFIANEDQSSVSRLNLADGKVLWKAPVGAEPEGIA